MALPVKKSQGEPATVDRDSVGAVPTSATEYQHFARRSCRCSGMDEKEEISMYINDEMAAEARWAGGGWQAEGEDGMGGIATRFAYRSPKVYFEAPTQPRHPHFTSPRRAAEDQPRCRSPKSAERARQARISRRRNAS